FRRIDTTPRHRPTLLLDIPASELARHVPFPEPAVEGIAMSQLADCVLTGGKVWKGLGLGFDEAVAIAGGKVLATGTAEEIAALAGPDTRVIDLAGRLATPGLYDAHLHLHMYGIAM